MITSVFFPLPLSLNHKFLKNVGDKISFGDPFFEYYSGIDSVEIDVSRILKVSPKHISSFLFKNLGDVVEKEEIIAQRRTGLFFKSTLEVRSEVSGKVFEVDNFSGKVKILGRGEKKIVKAPFSCKIKEILNDGVNLEFKGEQIIPIKIFGENFVSPVFFVSDADDEVQSDKITVEARNKIVFGGHFSLTDLNKAMAVGVKGVIATNISDSVLQNFENCRTFSFLGNKRKSYFSVAVLRFEEASLFEKLKAEKFIYFDAEHKKIFIPQ